MKRILLLAVAILITANVTVNAQTKVDVAGTKNKVAKLEEAVKDPKKAAKAVNWMNLGKAYYEAATLPVAGMYEGIDEKSAALLFGQPQSEGTENVGGVEYKKNSYAHFDAYFKDGAVVFWTPKTVIVDNALDKARDAFFKAAELDPKIKAREELFRVSDAYKQDASNLFAAMKYKDAADDFVKSYYLLANPSVNLTDTSTAYNAGFLYTVGGEFPKGKEFLEEALKYGYEQNGDTYYYLFHAYYGMNDIENAKKTLETGVGKYPTNSQIIEALLGIYAQTGENSEAILPYVQDAINNDPKNAGLYVGMGQIYDKLGDLDKAIESFQKAIEVNPDDFYANFNLGLTITKKADAFASELNSKTFTSNDAYNAELGKLNDIYRSALPSFEKAFEINPKQKVTVELLKNVYFRLRDEPGMMEKYEKYNGILGTM